MASATPSPRSWQQQADPTGAADRDTGPPWRREAPTRPVEPGAASRRLQIVLGFLSFFVFCGALIYALTWLLRPKPVRLVLVGASYEDNLAVPLNLHGRQSLRTFAELSRSGPTSGFLRFDGSEPGELRVGSAWDKGLDAAKEKTLFIVFGTHGAADGRGGFLLPHDAGPGDEEAFRLRLDRIVARLGELPAQKNKILVLDAAGLPADATLGVLHNDFARALDALESKIVEVPNLVVLSAAGPDERSWACEEWRETVYGHFAAAGLRGAADANADGKVTLLELHQFLSDKVSRWARVNRGAAQTPVLLPRGPEGERRAGAVVVSFMNRGAGATEPPDVPTFEVPAGLRAAWERHKRLREQPTHPASYAPHTWRRCEAWLDRYERAVRSGDEAAATALARKLTETEAELEKERTLDLTASLGASFAMPAAAGRLERAADRALRRRFDDFWEAPVPEHPKRWEEWKANAPAAVGEMPPRLAFLELLHERAAVAPKRDLEKSYVLLRLADEPNGIRPSEVHFLAMLKRHLPPGIGRSAPDDLIALALRVRRVAERAAVGTRVGVGGLAEQLAPWVEADVRAADAKRLEGEDALFGTNETAWGRSRVLLREAEVGYEQALAAADEVRIALRTRDVTLASLPHLAHWLAERRQTAPREDEERVRRVEDLWRETHRLSQLLERPEGRAAVVEVAAGVEAGRQEIEKHLAEAVKPLASPVPPAGTSLAELWHDADATLLVPNLDPETRLKVLTSLRRASRRLLQETTAPPSGPAPTADELRSAAQETARRRGRLAVASLGQRSFDALTGDDRWDYRKTRERLDGFTGEQPWEDELRRVGDQVGAHLRQPPREVRRLLSGEGDAARRRADLLAASRLARLQPAGVANLRDDNPARAYRRLLVQDLLLMQTRRAVASHWLAEDARALPAFRAAGQAFLADVKALDARSPLRAEADRVRGSLERDIDVNMVNPIRNIAVTGEAGFTTSYEVVTKADPLAALGQVALWVDVDSGLKLGPPAGEGRALRRANGDRPLEVEILRPLAADGPEAVKSSAVKPAALTLRGFYRGRVLEFPTRVDVYPIPDLTVRWRRPPPPAGLAVRASKEALERFGFGEGAVAVVLDCSGSMAAATGAAATEGRYRRAVLALESVCARLPRDTQVSVWTFGQATGAGKRADDAEATVQRVLDPTRWDPSNEKVLKDLVTRLEALEPYNESPLTRALIEAHGDVASARGFRTVVVVSDGVDNRFEKDAKANPEKRNSLAAIRQRFSGSGVSLTVVGFPPRGGDETRTREELKTTLAALDPPGKYYLVSDTGELAAALATAMRPHLRLGIEGRGVTSALDASPPGGNDRWLPGGLDAGGYTLSRQGSRSEGPSLPLRLTAGDRLLVDLVTTPRGLTFRRHLLASDFPTRPVRASERGDWQLAVLQNQRTKSGGLDMLLALEKRLAGQEADLELPRPREVWAEVGTDLETTAPVALTCTPEPTFPAAAWRLEAPSWPNTVASEAPARPLPRVWYDVDNLTPLRATRPLSPLLSSTFPLKGIDVNGDRADLESVAIERRVVEVRPGIREPRTCLVVRLIHPKGRPVIARVEGLVLDGFEHRLYRDPNRSVGLFWPVRGAPDELASARLGFVSVEQFKATASMIEIRDLKAPDPADVRPPSPPE